MKKHNKIGRILYFTGIWLNAIGFALAFVEDIPEPFPAFAIPMIVVGAILLIASNFFKKNREDKK